MTVARRISAVSSWYEWLRKAEYVAVSPAADVDRPAVDRDTSSTPGLTRGQATALLAAADTDPHANRARTAAIVAVLLYTGCRVGELLAADVADLGHNRGHRTLTVTRKGGKRQALALPAPVTIRLDAYLAGRGDQVAALPVPAELAGAGGRTGRPLVATASGRRLDQSAIRRLLRRLAAAAPELHTLRQRLAPHVLRHSYATLALDAGVSLRDLQDALGHTEPRTTRRYDRSRGQLDRSPGYTLTTYLAGHVADADPLTLGVERHVLRRHRGRAAH